MQKEWESSLQLNPKQGCLGCGSTKDRLPLLSTLFRWLIFDVQKKVHMSSVLPQTYKAAARYF